MELLRSSRMVADGSTESRPTKEEDRSGWNYSGAVVWLLTARQSLALPKRETDQNGITPEQSYGC